MYFIYYQDLYEEEYILSKVIDNIVERSGGNGKIMVYVFKEYFNLPVIIVYI